MWVNDPGGGGGGREGASWEFLVGVCHPVLQIQTLFQTKKYNFPHPFSDQTSKIHTRFQTWPLGRNYVLITRIRTQSKNLQIDGFHSDLIRLQSQKSEVLRILIYTRLKINKK